MLARFLVYGTLGWAVEIVWTGVGSWLRRDPRLTGQTYLWMFPIYGGGALLFEQLYVFIAGRPWFVLGLLFERVHQLLSALAQAAATLP